MRNYSNRSGWCDEHGPKGQQKAKKLGSRHNADGMTVGEELWRYSISHMFEIHRPRWATTMKKWWPRSLFLAQDDIYLGEITLAGIQSLMRSSLQKANWLRFAVMNMQGHRWGSIRPTVEWASESYFHIRLSKYQDTLG